MLATSMPSVPKSTLNIASNKMPAVKSMRLNDGVKMHVVGKVTRLDKDYSNPNVHHAEIEIQSIKPVTSGKISPIKNPWKNHTKES
jgi:hypothetical protein